MKEYFYSNGQDQQGPFSLEKLKECKITKETLIWFEGAKDWQKAGEIEELKSLIKELAPPKTVKSNKTIPKPISSSANQGKHPQTANIDTVNKSEVITQLGDEEKNVVKNNKKGAMFSSPFSFNGRIRRMEYGLSFIIFYISINIIIAFSEGAPIMTLLFIPAYWFLWAQGAKRCHDRGNNGWFQIIPFYGFWMIFADGDIGDNEYGPNPKGIN